jgi:hypothetical protein
MKRLTGLLLFGWLLAACSPTNTAPTDPLTPVEQAAQEVVEVLPEPTETPEVVSPTTLAEPPTPTEAIGQETPTMAVESTATIEPIDVELGTEPEMLVEPEPDQPLQMNGSYESTYFRGSADAPVTLVDFSDFL